jgi:hypothetical protein
MCRAKGVCGAGKVCDTSVVAAGRRKALYCNVTDAKLLRMLVLPTRPAQWPIEAFFKFDCTKPSSFNGTGAADGTCTASLHRLQRGAVFIDPYFWCTLRGCGMAVARGVATYACADTKCICARDPPPPYMPNCATSVFGSEILPNINGAAKVACDVASAACKFHAGLGSLPLSFSTTMKCNASSCDGA